MKLNDLSSYFELYRSLKESGKDMVLNEDLLEKEKEFVGKEMTIPGIVNEIDLQRKEIIITYRDEGDGHSALRRLISTHFFVFAVNEDLPSIVKQSHVEKNDLVTLSGTLSSIHRHSTIRMQLTSLTVNEKKFGLTKTKDRKGCFIATAVYGSPGAAEVQPFYRFRDEMLVNSFFGRLFIRFYYLVSPWLARFISNKPRLKHYIRRYILEKLRARLERF
jgi:hypothetical protein